jgi:hypothetical protein
MKCSFNDFIKANDVICMPLYRRVFPPFFEKAWNPNAKEQIRAKDEKFDKDGAMTD